MRLCWAHDRSVENQPAFIPWGGPLGPWALTGVRGSGSGMAREGAGPQAPACGSASLVARVRVMQEGEPGTSVTGRVSVATAAHNPRSKTDRFSFSWVGRRPMGTPSKTRGF